MDEKKGFDFSALLKHSELVIAAGVLGTIVVMILPIPAFVMDLFLVTNITVSGLPTLVWRALLHAPRVISRSVRSSKSHLLPTPHIR